jgi:hypothetical protein
MQQARPTPATSTKLQAPAAVGIQGAAALASVLAAAASAASAVAVPEEVFGE